MSVGVAVAHTRSVGRRRDPTWGDALRTMEQIVADIILLVVLAVLAAGAGMAYSAFLGRSRAVMHGRDPRATTLAALLAAAQDCLHAVKQDVAATDRPAHAADAERVRDHVRRMTELLVPIGMERRNEPVYLAAREFIDTCERRHAHVSDTALPEVYTLDLLAFQFERLRHAIQDVYDA